MKGTFSVLDGDALAMLQTMEVESVQCCVTSPPYWGLRDYGVAGQLGLEPTPELYVARVVEIFREVRRVLKSDGTLWLNLGDSYAGSWGARGRGPNTATARSDLELKHGTEAPNRKIAGMKPKDLVGIPWMVAFALRADGWYLRSDIIWHKPNPMPESVTDRPTKAHEYLFLLAKSERYFYDHESIKEPGINWGPRDRSESKHNTDGFRASGQPPHHGLIGTPKTDRQRGHVRRHAGFNERWDALPVSEQTNVMRNRRSVWTIAPANFTEAHFATFPTDLVEPCILAGCPEGGLVLDPFAGSGTVGVVALRHRRSFIGIELNPTYCEMARNRIIGDCPMFNEETQPSQSSDAFGPLVGWQDGLKELALERKAKL